MSRVLRAGPNGWRFLALGAALLAGVSGAAASAEVANGEVCRLSLDEKEEFLRTAAILEKKYAGSGITESQKALLERDGARHYAHIQTIDEARLQFETPMGKEMNFRDTWKYNVAAYELAKLLGVGDMVPPSVYRKMPGGRQGSVTWWVDNVLMEEGERRRKKLAAPDRVRWNCQMHVVRVFDQLIANTDRNMGNLLIDKDWRLWMIDHTRAFRITPDLLERKSLLQCDRKLFEKMTGLDRDCLRQHLGTWLTLMEIDGILKRRDKIVAQFDAAAKLKGEVAVFYDRRQP